MNESFETEIMQRKKLERQVLQATEHERARISQDLHDSICQELTATAFLLRSQSKSLAADNSPAAAALSEAAEMVNANAGATRDLARGLHPLELTPTGLIAALRELMHLGPNDPDPVRPPVVSKEDKAKEDKKTGDAKDAAKEAPAVTVEQ